MLARDANETITQGRREIFGTQWRTVVLRSQGAERFAQIVKQRLLISGEARDNDFTIAGVHGGSKLIDRFANAADLRGEIRFVVFFDFGKREAEITVERPERAAEVV